MTTPGPGSPATAPSDVVVGGGGGGNTVHPGGPGGITTPPPGAMGPQPAGAITPPQSMGPPHGITPAGSGPSTPGPRGAGVAGTFTRKAAKTRTDPVTWEGWWARNRYPYLDFPRLPERSSQLFPLTQSDKDNALSPDRMSLLKSKSVLLMRPLLDSPSARLRRAGLLGLARLDDTESLPRIKALLKDNNQTVRDAALLALGLIHSEDAKHTLLHLAQGSMEASRLLDQSSIPDYFRAFAEISLALSRTRGSEGILQSITQDKDTAPEVKAMALEGLGLLGGMDNTRFLIQFIETAKASQELMASAVTALGKSGDEAALPVLENLLFSDLLAVRQSAALALGRLSRADNENLVRKLYRCFRNTGDQALKGFALVSLGRIGGSLAVEYLDHQVTRGNSSDRAWALLGLGFAFRGKEGGPDGVVEKHVLDQLISEGNRSSRGAAAVALGLMASRNAVEPLTRIVVKGDDPYLRGYCAISLGMIQDPAALDALRTSLDDLKMPEIQIQVTQALALLRDSESVPRLVSLMIDSRSDFTKGFISLSLGFMGDVRIVQMMHDAMKEREMDDITMLHCVHLTSRLLSGRVAPYLDPLAQGSNMANEYPLVRELLDYGI